jgi:hypothetical protein
MNFCWSIPSSLGASHRRIYYPLWQDLLYHRVARKGQINTSQNYTLVGTGDVLKVWPIYVAAYSADLFFLLRPLFLFCLFVNINF